MCVYAGTHACRHASLCDCARSEDKGIVPFSRKIKSYFRSHLCFLTFLTVIALIVTRAVPSVLA